MTNANTTNLPGTLKGHGRTLRITPWGSRWMVSEATTVAAEYADGDTDDLAAVEVLGYYDTKPEAIAAARKIIW